MESAVDHDLRGEKSALHNRRGPGEFSDGGGRRRSSANARGFRRSRLLGSINRDRYRLFRHEQLRGSSNTRVRGEQVPAYAASCECPAQDTEETPAARDVPQGLRLLPAANCCELL